MRVAKSIKLLVLNFFSKKGSVKVKKAGKLIASLFRDVELPDGIPDAASLATLVLKKLLKKGLIAEDCSYYYRVEHDQITTVAEPSDKKRKREEAKDEDKDEVKEDEDNIQQIYTNAVIKEGQSASDIAQKPRGDKMLLLFYAYADPPMTRVEQDQAIGFCYSTLEKNGITGRLRIGREGYNGTLTGPRDGVRAFTSALRTFCPRVFSETDFKFVDGQPDNYLLKGLKVWPVSEIVTYGFDPEQAPLHLRGKHLKPAEFHQALANPNSVVIDVRNFNESLIGKFSPPVSEDAVLGAPKVLDPQMRRSTEFPEWVQKNKDKLEGKQVLMYCTAGVRCERASAFLRYHGVKDVNQLEGGIHRYLEAFPDDGGYWVGKNYVFDKRFAHGARRSEVISNCVACNDPWDRYQAQMKCAKCAMEVLVCRICQRKKDPPVDKKRLFCPLCFK